MLNCLAIIIILAIDTTTAGSGRPTTICYRNLTVTTGTKVPLYCYILDKMWRVDIAHLYLCHCCQYCYNLI